MMEETGVNPTTGARGRIGVRGGGPVRRQSTLGAEAQISGHGLFTGAPVNAAFRPAPADHGVVFVRVDLPGAPSVPARVEHVVDRPRRTTLKRGEAVVETVEHCLSALAGMGVDNVVIELDGPELPAVDGSASPFVELIRRAGVVEQDAARRPLVISELVSIRDGDAIIAAMPSAGAGMELLYDLDYGADSFVERQAHAFTLEPTAYAERIAPARTYALYEEAQALRERGLFRHLTPKDMLVIGRTGPIDNALRFADEPVRHKVLDMVGDLSLVGRPIQGRVVASRSGHALNHRLARALLEGADRNGDGAALAPALGAMAVAGGAPVMDIRQVLRLLPHRYPMVLVDRVLEMDGDRRAVGIKNVSINEPFFQGHYPGSPIMPGVLIVEAMSQLAGLMLSQKLERTGKIAVLLSLDNVKLRKAVTPGDQLVMETEAVRATNRFGDVSCRAFVQGQLVAEAKVKFMMVDAEQDR